MQSYERFAFQGNNYLLSMLRHAKIIKTYWDRSKSERHLVCDEYGRLFLYCWEEETTFDGTSDRLDLLWVLVKNEEEADSLKNEGLLTLSNHPHISTDRHDWMNVVDE
jgi:hypothetical protein